MKYTFDNSDKEVTISDFKFAGVMHWDYPDYADAFLQSAKIDGREATEAELDEIQEDSDLVYSILMDDITLY